MDSAHCSWFWVVLVGFVGFVGGFGWFWVVLLVVLGGFGSFWVVLGGFGWFWVVPCFSNYEANRHHPIIKFTAEICRDETFLDTKIYKGQRFYKDSDLYMRTHFKPMETFQCKFLTLCHPPGVKKGLVKGEALSHCLEQTLQSKHLKKTLQYFKNTLWREAIQSQQRTKDTRPPPTKRNKKTTLALHNTITPSS